MRSSVKSVERSPFFSFSSSSAYLAAPGFWDAASGFFASSDFFWPSAVWDWPAGVCRARASAQGARSRRAANIRTLFDIVSLPSPLGRGPLRGGRAADEFVQVAQHLEQRGHARERQRVG